MFSACDADKDLMINEHVSVQLHSVIGFISE
jgi:hypothetical protein